MATSHDGRQAADPVAAFREQLAELREQGVYDSPTNSYVPWDEASESSKLESVLHAARRASLMTGRVSSAEALAAVEREVDPAGLPAWQREMLGDVRARLDAGGFDEPQTRGSDRIERALNRIVGRDRFDRKLEGYKATGVYGTPRRIPWAEVPEHKKVGVIVGLARHEGPAGAYALATIEREVDYGRLPAWRRAALEGLRDRLDRGELAGDQPRDLRDRANYALRLAEFESRIEDYIRLGGQNEWDRHLQWREFTDLQKLDRIVGETIALQLHFEPVEDELIDREVDLSRVPEVRRRGIESNREAMRLGPEEYERRRQAPYKPPNEAAAEFKRRIEEDLWRTCFTDGETYFADWQDLAAEEKLHHLAKAMDWDRVPQAYFRTMVGRELDVAELPEAKRAALASPKASRRAFSEGLDAANDQPAAPPSPEERSPRVETDGEKDRRHQHLLFEGAPMPEGWRLPSLIDPPDRSDPAAVQRANREISSLKSARFESWRPVPFDAGAAIEPGKKGHWNEMTEFAKLDAMQHWVNWEGVGNPDRVGMMAGQLDLEKLPSVLREQLREHGGPADGLEGRGFEAAGASQRPRSPSDIAREGRPDVGAAGGPDARRPSDIAKEGGAGAPGPERSVKDENDRDR